MRAYDEESDLETDGPRMDCVGGSKDQCGGVEIWPNLKL